MVTTNGDKASILASAEIISFDRIAPPYDEPELSIRAVIDKTTSH